MIKFKKLTVQNFLSFGNNKTELDLAGGKVNLITGTNGAGKSSLIVEGLTFALFGTGFRDVKKAQLVNFINDKNCLVELEFSINTDDYKIVRGIKPNVLKLYKNDSEVPEASSSKLFQEYIETEILRMNIISFKQLVVLGTANFIPFMQLSTPQRRKLIDDLLDVSMFTVMDQMNKGNIKELTQQMNNNSIALTGLKNELQAYQLLLKEKTNSVFSNQELIQSEILEKQLKAKDLQKKIEELNLSINSLNQMIQSDNTQETLKKLEMAQNLLNNRIKCHHTEISEIQGKDVCLSCQQKITEENKQVIIKKIQSELDADKSKLNSADDKIKGLADDLNVYNQRVNQLNQKNQELAKLSTEFRLVLDDIKKLMSQQNQPEEDNSEIINKVKSLEKQIKIFESNQQNWFNEKYLRTVLGTLLVDSGIKATVIKKFIPVINKKINSYLKILGADYMFFLDNEFNEQIRGSGREKASYYSFSQGEKSRVDIALMFTLRDISSIVSGTSIDLLVMDEVMDSSLDSVGNDAIKTIVDRLPANVYIISHREQNSDDYNRHIKVEKKGRFSQLEVKIND